MTGAFRDGQHLKMPKIDIQSAITWFFFVFDLVSYPLVITFRVQFGGLVNRPHLVKNLRERRSYFKMKGRTRIITIESIGHESLLLKVYLPCNRCWGSRRNGHETSESIIRLKIFWYYRNFIVNMFIFLNLFFKSRQYIIFSECIGTYVWMILSNLKRIYQVF